MKSPDDPVESSEASAMATEAELEAQPPAAETVCETAGETAGGRFSLADVFDALELHRERLGVLEYAASQVSIRIIGALLNS